MCVCGGGVYMFYCRSGRINQVTLATSKRSEIRRTAEKSHACIINPDVVIYIIMVASTATSKFTQRQRTQIFFVKHLRPKPNPGEQHLQMTVLALDRATTESKSAEACLIYPCSGQYPRFKLLASDASRLQNLLLMKVSN